jgi:hypothetical protein
MTIRRQYSLPNCTLILDGLNDGSSNSGFLDPRPLMSQLLNAECHFAGHPEPLAGGQDFLTSLIATVNNYAQEVLSGIPHPAVTNLFQNGISLVKGDRDNVHHLQFLPSDPAHVTPSRFAGFGKEPVPMQIELSTVQLFDLVEAIDQFLADGRTLPDLNLYLKPLPKASTNPIAKQAAPAGVGIAGLAAIAFAFYVIPAPKVAPPKVINVTPPVTAPDRSTSGTNPTANPQSGSTAGVAPTPDGSSKSPSK